jgi:hypothetical protein
MASPRRYLFCHRSRVPYELYFQGSPHTEKKRSAEESTDEGRPRPRPLVKRKRVFTDAKF